MPILAEKGRTATAFPAQAKAWFAAHGIGHIHRAVTDNGACYRSNDFARIVEKRTRHQKTRLSASRLCVGVTNVQPSYS